MRRILTAVSVALLLIGLELSTEGISLVLGRLRVGWDALTTGAEVPVGGGRYVVGLVFVLIAVVLAGLVMWSRQAESKVHMTGRGCPQCGTETRRVKRKERHRLLSALLGQRLTRRRCETCGWAGLSLRY